MSITYCIDNKLGGVSSLNYNLAANALPGVKQTVLHINAEEWNLSAANIHFPVDKEIDFNFSVHENAYSRIRRFYKLIPDEAGALILNYEMEMYILDRYPIKQTSFQLVHDSWNVRLAEKYGHISDVFICHNTVIYQELINLFPARKQDIFYLPHGVKIPVKYRSRVNENEPLRLLFLGRISSAKGVFDLPVISSLLRERDVEFEWTCIGNGPELAKLKEEWNSRDKVQFLSPATNDEVLSICADMDVFVLPTKFEGSPVSLLEAMSVGLVPVVTDLPGGITDIVKNEIGYRIPINDNIGFANAIATLNNNRALLNTLSINCRKKIIEEFDVKQTAKAYHGLFMRYKEFYKPKEHKKMKIGSTLDHPLIPSLVSKTIRKIAKRTK
ncbi:MAG: glycosyltransferase family 4 protein [Ferruginibacter sp.]